MDETVSYAYDAGGLRTQITLPGSKTIAYSYDEVGRLIGLTAWDDQHSDFHYDKVGRHVATQRPNGLLSDYAYNPAGHLRRVRHRAGSSLRGQFNYTVDGRGNRTQAVEKVAKTTTIPTSGGTYNRDNTTGSPPPVEFLPDNTSTYWENDGSDFRKTSKFSSRMKLNFAAEEANLTIGVGQDHGLFDIYINGWLWRRFDGYEDTTDPDATKVIHLPEIKSIDPPTTNYGTVEIRVRSDKNANSNGRVFRFSKVELIQTSYDEHSIAYTYDGLSRLQQANYGSGKRVYDFDYDLAGNRLAELLSGTEVTDANHYFGYDAANRMIAEGDTLNGNGDVIADFTYEYNLNGNLIYKKNTVPATLESYAWDYANRMLSVDNGTLAEKVSYAYDGLGNRVSMSVGTTSPTVTDYLLDVQPGLVKVLAQTTGATTDRFVHSPRGIHAMQDNASDWRYMTQDGLGSVRSEIDEVLMVGAAQHYAPYGEPFGTVGNFNTPFAFTGEQVDSTGQVYLRARYYNPSMGVFPSLDPFEGTMARPMSLNAYSWVEGNVPNMVDPSGMECESLEQKLMGTNGYWCEKLQNTLRSSLFEVPSFEEVLYCYSCAMDSSLGDSPEAYEQGLRQAESDGMANSQRIQFVIDEYRNNYVSPISLGSDTYSFFGADVKGYAEGWSISGNAVIFGGQIGIETTYNFATFQRMNFRYEGYSTPFNTGSKVKGGGGLYNYAAYISGFTPQRCKSGSSYADEYAHFYNQYRGRFIIENFGGGFGAGGGYFEFGSPDESITGAGVNVSIGTGIDIGASWVWYRFLSGRKSYINPITGKVNVEELSNDILNGDGSVIDLTEYSIAGAVLRDFRAEAAFAAETLALAYNSSSAAQPCSC